MHRKLFYAFNFLLLAVFIASLIVDYNKDWRKYQNEYFIRSARELDLQAEQSKDPEQAKRLRADARALRSQPIMIRQIIVKDLGRFDRCVTCHVGMDEFANPTLKTPFKEHPFKGHPDLPGMVKNHPFAKFGCTSCHGGQGMALTVEAAHGKSENWEKPLLKGHLIQASCAKCHGNFRRSKARRPWPAAERRWKITAASVVIRSTAWAVSSALTSPRTWRTSRSSASRSSIFRSRRAPTASPSRARTGSCRLGSWRT